MVELAAAVKYEKPVVMLIGEASADGTAFAPNDAMIDNLFFMTDVRQAAASVEADRVRELRNVEEQEGGADAVNTLARGAVMGALWCMKRRDILAAVVGNMEPLRALKATEERNEAMRCRASVSSAKTSICMLLKRSCISSVMIFRSGSTSRWYCPAIS